MASTYEDTQTSGPQVAPIGDSNQSPANAGTPTIDQIMSIAGLGPQTKLPSATVPVHVSNPNIPQVRQFQPNQLRPVEGSVADKIYARHRNAMADATNAVGKVIQGMQQKKVEQITHNVKTVMDSQQMIDSATAILNDPNASPQDKKNAQAVIENNKKLLDRLFSDKKTANELKKAFDVSYTDPEKNNKPEVKGMLAGLKQHLLGVKAGTTADSPEEKAVLEAQKRAEGKQLTTNNPNNPANSNTPYADQFLKSQATGLAPNPQYEAAVKAQEKKQEAILKAIPTIITQQNENIRKQAELEQKDRAVAANNQQKVANEAAREANERAIAGARIAAQMKIEGQKEAAAMQRLTTGINMRDEIAVRKTTNPAMQAKLYTDNFKALTSANAALSKEQADLEIQKNTVLGHKDGYQETQAIKELDDAINRKKAQMKQNDALIEQYQARLGALGVQGVPNGGSSSSTSESRITTESISNGTARYNTPGEDTPDGDEDDNADDYNE